MAETTPITMIRGDENLINSTEIVDGQILFDETNKCLLVDDGDTRVKYSGLGSDPAVASTEVENTASKAYSIGDYVILPDKLLYKVTKAIAVGDTFTVDTNIKQTTVGAEIVEVNNRIKASAIPSELGTTVGDAIANLNTHLTAWEDNFLKLRPQVDNPVSVWFGVYTSAFLIGFAQNIGGVAILISTQNDSLVVKDIIKDTTWSNSHLTFTWSNKTLTIKSDASGRSKLIMIKEGS